MFCTNCGAQNNDEVLNCQKCGFKLKDSPASKFKGTMLMMNAPANIQALQGGAPPAAAPAPTAPVAVPPTGPMPGAGLPAAGSVAANASAAPAVTAKANFKGTMIGVAPPSLGGPVVPAAAPVGGAPPNFSHAPSTNPASPGAIAAGVSPPLSPVNPLGGTLVAGDKRSLGVADVAINTAPNSPVAPTGPMGAGPAGNFGGDAFGSTLPSGKDAPTFASTTPSAGNQSPNFANAPQGGVQPTRPMAQAPGSATPPGASQGVLITLIVILVVSLCALVWTVLQR